MKVPYKQNKKTSIVNASIKISLQSFPGHQTRLTISHYTVYTGQNFEFLTISILFFLFSRWLNFENLEK